MPETKTVAKKEQRRHHNRREMPAASKRVPDVIAENKDWVIDRWLERMKANAELMGVSLSKAERTDHVPDLLDEAIAHSCGYRIHVEGRQKAAERHGTLRYHQGYSIPMLILEAHLLQDVIAECIRENFAVIDFTTLIPDIAKVSETLVSELEESSRAYMQQFAWQANRSSKRAKPA